MRSTRAEDTGLDKWWLWCSGNTAPCEGAIAGSNPTSHPNLTREFFSGLTLLSGFVREIIVRIKQVKER